MDSTLLSPFISLTPSIISSPFPLLILCLPLATKEASVTRADEWRAKQEEGDSVWVIMEVKSG